MLDEVVIWVAGVGERVEPQRIDRRQPQQPKVGLCRGEVRQVEENQVVAQQEGGTLREIVQVCQGRAEVTVLEDQSLAGIRPDRREGMDATVLLSHLEVERETWEGRAWLHVRRMTPVPPNAALRSNIIRRPGAGARLSAPR